jgi:hypothetical protein
MEPFPITDKTKITRLPKRGVYDKEVVYSILDEALFCTLAFVRDQQPYQIPTGFCRIGNQYISPTARAHSEDYDLPIWAGVLPLRIIHGAAVADPALKENIALPPYLTA